ncbi:MAG TPA: pilin [Candidatus Saccharimonadales bacterium]|nr:pilin [Candidatus Saccharimonadales bacterium]
MNIFTALQLVEKNSLPQVDANQTTLQNIFNIVFVIIGALAFLMLVIAGFRYVTSQGQPDKVADIKRQIIYSFVGLVVAAMAAVIVNFVLGRV